MQDENLAPEFKITVQEEARLRKKCDKWGSYLFASSGFLIILLVGFFLAWKRNSHPLENNELMMLLLATFAIFVITLAGFLRAHKKHKIIEQKLDEFCGESHQK